MGGRLPDRPGKPKCVVRVNWEHLVEAPVCGVFNLRKLGTWNPSGSFSKPPLERRLLGPVVRRLTVPVVVNPLVDTSSEGRRQSEVGGLSGSFGPPETADGYRNARRAVASVVAEAKNTGVGRLRGGYGE